ncbi:MAG: hypothetical protein IJO09_06540 [Oscillospiraceae bacterium]|nr:hypothetical protein [Oscillospiraceae bacterium]
MGEKMIRIDLIKNLQEVLSSIEDTSQELFALDDEVAQGAELDNAALFYAALSISADIEKAKRIVYKLKVFQRKKEPQNAHAEENHVGRDAKNTRKV